MALLLAEVERYDDCRAELAMVCGGGASQIPRDANWTTGMALLAITSFLAGVADYATEAYELLLPYENRFVTIGQCADWYGSLARSLGEYAAVLGDYERAVAHIERAIEADATRGATRMELRGKWELATILRRRNAPGDSDRAAAVAGQALPVAERLGLVVVAERLRNVLDV
jgi:hypothetical protein